MNPRFTLVLLFVALGLGGYVFLTERRAGVTVTADGGAKAAFTPIVPEQVTAVELARSNGIVRVERAAGGWTMRLPVAYPAQGAAIDAFLDATAKLRPRSWIPAVQMAAGGPDAARAFGFDDTATKLTLETATASTILKLGGPTPLSGNFYFQRVGDDGVFTADAAFLDALPGSAAAWRDRGLFDLRETVFDRLELRGKTAFEAAKDPTNGTWRLVRPLAARADSGRLDALVHTLQTVRVAQFISDAPGADPEPYGLQPPEAELLLSRGTNTLAHLQFGRSPTNSPDGVYVRRMAQTNVVLVPTNAVGVLRGSLATFRDHRLLPPLADSTRVEFAAGGTATVVERSGTNWDITAPAKFPADPELMDFLFAQLASVAITDFPNDVVADYGRYGLTSPARTYGFAQGTNAPLQLQFGALQDAEHVFARRLDENGVYAVRLSDLLQLPETADQLRDFHFASSNVVKVVVNQKGNTRTLERGADGQWAVTAGTPGAPFSPAVEDTLHRIGDLRTTRYPERDETRLASYAELAHEVVLTLGPGAPIRSLRLRFAADLGAVAFALASFDDTPAAVRIEIPGPLFRDIRRDFSAW